MYSNEQKGNNPDYVLAVSQALAGRQEGYDLLYQSTYQKKFYIAKKYMGNDSDAQDVLQDAYVQAFSKLDTLKEPNKFPGWLGMIVANTAKNALQKKKMVFFSDLEGVNDEGEAMELQWEDTNVSRQPEMAYTEKETQEMVRTMIDALPEDQRMCILMFHLEGASIREIAEAMECSENTVKSRLNYGRKGIKKQSEELQRRGYKLYNMAPLPLLLYLLHSEENAFLASGHLVIPPITTILDQLRNLSAAAGGTGTGTAGTGAGAGTTTAGKTLGHSVASTAGKTFLHSVAGKITMVAAGVAVTGGIGLGTVLGQSSPDKDATAPSQQIEATATPAATVEATATPEPTATPVPLADKWKKAYKKFLSKKLTMEHPLEEGKKVHISDYYYLLYDVNGDNIPELCISGQYDMGRYDQTYQFYTYSEKKGVHCLREEIGISPRGGLYYRPGKPGIIMEDGGDFNFDGDWKYEGHIYTYTMKNGKMKYKEKQYTCPPGFDVDHSKYWPKGMKALPKMKSRKDLSGLEKAYEKYKQK